METVRERIIRVHFNADTAASMTWNFRPQQNEIKVWSRKTRDGMGVKSLPSTVELFIVVGEKVVSEVDTIDMKRMSIREE